VQLGPRVQQVQLGQLVQLVRLARKETLAELHLTTHLAQTQIKQIQAQDFLSLITLI
jgi:hypothetical protein